jgi:hypothetical protein
MDGWTKLSVCVLTGALVPGLGQTASCWIYVHRGNFLGFILFAEMSSSHFSLNHFAIVFLAKPFSFELISDLHWSCKNSTKNCFLSDAIANSDILSFLNIWVSLSYDKDSLQHYHSMIIRTRKLTWIHWYHSFTDLFTFPRCLSNVPCSKSLIQGQALHLGVLPL